MEKKIMDERKIIEIMKARGYSYSYKVLDGEGKVKFLEFIYVPDEKSKIERFPVPSYCCTINVKDNKFSFTYIIPGSVNKLKMEGTSPFWSDDQFDRLVCKFEMQAAVLNKYCDI